MEIKLHVLFLFSPCFRKEQPMTVYQEEMIRKANRYGCDTTHDEGSGG
jgi:hypothetical protein